MEKGRGALQVIRHGNLEASLSVSLLRPNAEQVEGVSGWRTISCATAAARTLAGVESTGTTVETCVDVDERTEDVAELVVELVSCTREDRAEVATTSSGSKQRSGTAPTADGVAAVSAGTDTVTSLLGHCVEQVVGGRATTPTRLSSRAAHAARTEVGAVEVMVANAVPGMDVERSGSSSEDEAQVVASIAGVRAAVDGGASQRRRKAS